MNISCELHDHLLLILALVLCNINYSSPTGDKYNKAREWGIHCVNAKWLGDIVTSRC